MSLALTTSALMTSRPMIPEQMEAASALVRLGAVGTCLANLRDDAVRASRTALSVAEDKAPADARQTALAAPDNLFGPADRIFAGLDAGCVKSALDKPL